MRRRIWYNMRVLGGRVVSAMISLERGDEEGAVARLLIRVISFEPKSKEYA